MILSIFEVYMTTKEQIKNTGATFTPRGLSVFLAERIAAYAQPKQSRVLDPACGEGELLIAMGEVLDANAIDFSLTGYDANEQYLNFAKDRLMHLGVRKTELHHKDFLQVIDITTSGILPSLFDQNTSEVNNSYDIVIANPPYVRTQILGTEQAQALSKKFNLKGRVDLYYPFLIAMTESLKEGGLIGVITSNRYLSTKSGESVRKFLSENYEILELIDLGDTKLFNAAVLPAIFIGRKKQQRVPSPAGFMKVYEDSNGNNSDLISAESIYHLLKSNQAGYFSVSGKRYKKTTGILKYKIASGTCWEMLSVEESEWVSKIDRSANNRVGDFLK